MDGKNGQSDPSWKIWVRNLLVGSGIFFQICFVVVMALLLSPRLWTIAYPILLPVLSGGTSIYTYGQETYTTRERVQFNLSGGGLDYALKLYSRDEAFEKICPDKDRTSLHLNPVFPVDEQEVVRGLQNFQEIKSLNGKLTLREHGPAGLADFGRLEPGTYLVILNSNHVRSFRVTDIGFLMRQAPDRTLLKVFDLNTLAPVAATINVYANENDHLSKLAQLKTDPQGCLEYVHSATTPLVFHAVSGKNEAVSYSSAGEDKPDRRLVDVRTDKTIYRLGQSVSFRALVRSIANDGLANNVANKPVTVTVRDPQGEEIFKAALRTGPFGDLTGSFTLPEHGHTGSYEMALHWEDGVGTTEYAIQVAEYRKPEFEVVVEPTEPFVVAGDTAHVKIKARYFFGAPVVGAVVSYTVSSSADWYLRESLKSKSASEDGFFPVAEPSSYEGYGGYDAKTLTAVTDASGIALVSFKVVPPAGYVGAYEANCGERNFHVAATVTDISRKVVEADGSVVMTPGKFALFIEPLSRMFERGQAIQAFVQGLDYEGKPVDADVRVSLERWSQGDNAQRKETVLAQTQLRAPKGGARTLLQFPADLKSGQYQLVTRAQADGKIADWTQVWVLSDGEQNSEVGSEGQAPTVELDHRVYQVGDTIKALVRIPSVAANGVRTALATMEGVTIFDHKSLVLDKNLTLIEFTASQSSMPGVNLVVQSVGKNRAVSIAQVPVRIYPKPALLNLSIETDQKRYKPGQTAVVSCSATTPDGKPAAGAQVALSLVDESIYALQPDNGQDLEHVFWGTRPDWIQSQISFDQVSTFELPEPLPLFVVPPLSLFSLGGATRESNLFDGEAASTRCCKAQCAPTPSPAACPAPAGPMSSPVSKVAVRSNFQDTAAWAPNLVTGSDGKATLKVKLPDNLTNWRAVARAINKQSQVRTAAKNITVSKDLIARLSLPRFFTQDDESVLTGIVHNYTKLKQDIKLELAPSAQLKVDQSLTKTITIEPEGHAAVNWPVKVTGVGKAQVVFKAIGATDGDALVEKLPVRSFSFPAFAAKNGVLKNDNEKLDLPLLLTKDARPGSGRFSLSLSASAIGPVLGNFDKLIDYPYGCTEQTMSRMVPSVVAMCLHDKLKLPISAAAQARFKEVHRESFLKLIEHHNTDDGGWGWWHGDHSNPYLTAYVMEGLKLLYEAGYKVDQSLVDSGLEWLRKYSESRFDAPWNMDACTDDAYCLYVRTLYGDKPAPLMVRRYLNQCSKLGPEGRAYLVLAFMKAGDKASAAAAYKMLMDIANTSWEFTDWDHSEKMIKALGGTGDFTYRFTGVESTALAMRAVLLMEPDNEKLLTGIRRWILLQRDSQGWCNTKTTASVFLALLEDELRFSGAAGTNFTAVTSVGGKTLASQLFNKGNQYGAEKIIELTLSGNEQKLDISKNGSGRLYYSSLLTYDRAIKPGQTVVPRSSPPDLSITRKFWRLESFKTKEGTIRTRKVPLTGARAGETIMMTLSIDNPLPLPYVMVNAALPAGAEVTSLQDQNGPILAPHPVASPTPIPISESSTEPSAGGTQEEEDPAAFSLWWTHQDVLDDRIVFFVTDLPKGKSQFSTLLRLETPGKLNVNPVTFEAMYAKNVRGYSAADTINVRE